MNVLEMPEAVDGGEEYHREFPSPMHFLYHSPALSKPPEGNVLCIANIQSRILLFRNNFRAESSSLVFHFHFHFRFLLYSLEV